MTERSMGILQQADEERARRKDNPVTPSKSKDNLCDDWPQIKARLEEAIKPGWNDEGGRPLYPPPALKDDIRSALQRESEQAEQLRKSHERTLYLSQKLMDSERQCHNVRGEDGSCDCAGCQDTAALRQRVEELEREVAESRRFEDASESDLKIEVAARNAAEAKLARVVKALTALLDYTVQVEQLAYDVDEQLIKHPIVVLAEAALAAAKEE